MDSYKAWIPWYHDVNKIKHMEIKTFDELVKANNIYGLRLWSCGPYREYLPFEVQLEVYRPFLKKYVCDILGLDVDAVIKEMCENWEYYDYDNLNGTVIPYAMYIINKDARVWYSDADWDENEKEGGMYELLPCIDLNDMFDLRYDYQGNYSDLPNVEHNITYTKVKSGSNIRLCAYMSTTCVYENGDINTNKRRMVTMADAIDFYEPCGLKMHGGKRHGYLDNQYSHEKYKFFDNEQECKAYVDTIFNVNKENEYRSKQLKADYEELSKKKAYYEEQLKKAEAKMKNLNSEYKSINKTNIA